MFVGLFGTSYASHGDIWTQLPTRNFPEIRSEYDMAYDTFHKKIIAYGGRTGFRSDFQNVNETWAFDYDAKLWTNLVPTSTPPWRSSHSMVYDRVGRRVLMFGGDDFTRAFNDLWQYDYGENEWADISSTYSPEARQMHGMVYVPDREVVVLFGGRKSDGGAFFNDTWELDCATNSWKKLDPENKPPVTDHVNITYDVSEKKVVLFTNPDTWAYDFDIENWTILDPSNPPDVDHSNFVYSPHSKKSVLLGSSSTSDSMFTWVFDYSDNAWTDITPPQMPGDFIEHDAMVYLDDQNVFIQYGGCCTDKTLELDLEKLRVP